MSKNNLNNKNYRAAEPYVAFLLLGAFMGLGLGFFLYSTEESTKLNVLLFMMVICTAVSTFFIFMDCLFKSIIIPYISRRRAAIRALGKDGIRLIFRDKTAKLAYKGIYAVLKGNFPDAEDHLQQALAESDIRQNQLFCVEWLVRLYEATENNTKLLWCYRKAAEYAPDNPDVQSRLGHAYFSEGNLSQAEYCFEQALRYDPNNGYSYFSLVKIYLLRGEDDRALETLQTLLKINENHPLAHSEFANYYAMHQDREKAEEEVKKALLCGYKEPDEINRRINAMLSFHTTDSSGEDLPSLYYRRIEKKAKE